ncbi:MAG TPA: T9SS type A sorting domain-containing protein, partial [Candidatus Kapabacteria bacterium]
DANVLFSGYARTTIVDANNQIWSQPGSGTLLFWKKGMVDPRYLVSAFVDEVIPGPELESSFLAAWQPGTLDFQGVNLRHPVVAQSADPSKYSVYFSAIATDDFGTVTEFQEPDRNPTDKLAFMSIWKITSLDGGATFTNPVKVAGNEDGMPQELRLDYRFPQSSYFNPEGGGKALDRIMFSVDTCPGLPAEGYVGFNDMHWMTMQVSTSGVKAPVTFGTTISLGQNYPNPSLSGKTLIPFELTNSGEVVMTVTDLIGREVMTLTPGRMEAGKQTLPVDISRLTNGVYQYTLRSGGETLSRLMTIVKD